MRKRMTCIALALCMLLSLCACGSSKAPVSETPTPATETGKETAAPSEPKEPTENTASDEPADTTPEPESEDDGVDNAAWDTLESMGKIETENGLFYVNITLPADFVGEDVTQESIDAKAGETYTSGKLNDDGSVTYKMTKKQHKAMLDGITESIETSLQDMVDSSDNAFTKIDHNSDFTSFDAHVSTEELGFAESFMVLGFYMYGGMYGIFTGKEVDNISVNFYSASGKLINTANSSDMKG